MKLTVLGCWAPYPPAGGACPGYLVQSDENNILVDCGNGVLSNLQKYIDFRAIDGVIISHLHPDHYVDIFPLRHAVEIARQRQTDLGPVPLYLPNEPKDTFAKIAGYREAFTVIPIESLPGSEINGSVIRAAVIGHNKIRLIRTDHPIPTYAVSVEGKGRLFYSADTKWTDYLPEFARGSDTILCEASFTEENKTLTSVGHLTCRQAGELARASGAGQLVATHFWPGYSPETIKSEAEAGFGGKVILAHEGLQVAIK
ncbi:MAG TPA: MBL fold metallo-hydrolase [Desulfobacteria bacterium]|nr:MBL fold metallo-hydrolase [Desulfobacteria bacterium]